MSHVRKQIRDAVVTALTGLATTGANVYASRLYPFQEDGSNLPGLAVFLMEETVIEPDDEENEIGTQQREAMLVIEGYAESNTSLDDTLDQIAAEVETAIYADQFFGGLTFSTILESTDMEIATEAAEDVGYITLNFRVQYLTREGAPETAL